MSGANVDMQPAGAEVTRYRSRTLEYTRASGLPAPMRLVESRALADGGQWSTERLTAVPAHVAVDASGRRARQVLEVSARQRCDAFCPDPN